MSDVTSPDWTAARDAARRLLNTIAQAGFIPPEDTERLHIQLQRAASDVNDIATALRLIKPSGYEHADIGGEG